MRLSVGKKIFGIALFLLVVMSAAASVAIHLTAQISAELEAVSKKYLPVSDTVSRINVQILEQGIIFQRIIVQLEEGVRESRIANEHQQVIGIAATIDEEFTNAQRLLSQVGGSTYRQAHLIAANISGIEKAYVAFSQYGEMLLGAKKSNDPELPGNIFHRFNEHQDAVDNAIAGLRRSLKKVVDQSIVKADRDEYNLLLINVLLTTTGAFIGLGFAMLITRGLVRSVKNLVAGAEAVEAGNLDTSVLVTSHDELGSLTGSFNHMVGELRLKERIKNTFGKYMDPRIVANLVGNPELTKSGGESREMTVIFIDLKGFTSISEKLGPNALVHMINRFFTLMTKAITDNSGVVDKYMGDAVMAYWGPPFTEPDKHAILACQAAVEALEYLGMFRDQVAVELGAEAERLDIDMRIGISTGEMIVGTIGSEVSKSFTVMGDPVNLGSRLEGASKAYGTRILLSDRTREAARSSIQTREIDIIRVKGKDEPTRIHELLTSGDSRPELAELFEQGLSAYRECDWDGAEESFRTCLKTTPCDPPSNAYLARISHLRENPPPPGWEGVWTFETK